MSWGNALYKVFFEPDEDIATVLLAAGFATVGWWYSARANRKLFRKQHTVNVMLDASMNKEMREALSLSPRGHTALKPPDYEAIWDKEKRDAFRLLVNHYEFLAAGIRNHDLDEHLVFDCEFNIIRDVFETYKPFIEQRRTDRGTKAVYEHLEWLITKWELRSPMSWRRFWHVWKHGP